MVQLLSGLSPLREEDLVVNLLDSEESLTSGAKAGGSGAEEVSVKTSE
jgi:hypothetical protein